MELIYIFLIFSVSIIIAIGLGIQISQGIEEFIIKVLFWLLYIVTIITFINIVLVASYYINLKDKTGPPGPPGAQGDRGNKGEAGKCDIGCRDGICENRINELVMNELLERNEGVAPRFNNVYIKSKIKQICSSDEFRQLAPYNGPVNLINYIADIWKIWIGLLYEAGGANYFENIGAEEEFEWLTENPFFEIKKYDIFYWGMGKQYRPQIVDKCYNSIDGETPAPDSVGSIIKVSKTDLYDFITNSDNIGAYQQVSFWRAKQFTYKGAVFYPVGDIAVGPSRFAENSNTSKHVGIITYPYASKGPARETIIVTGDVKGPVNYDLLWTNYGMPTGTAIGTPNYFWVWRPIAPVNYIALGDVITTTANPPDTGNNAPIRCIPKEVTTRIAGNSGIMWSSNGSRVNINLNLLGFIPNTDGSGYVSASDSNVYNLFRGVVGMITTIPESDINANFYYIDSDRYDTTFEIGKDYGNPDESPEANRVGKGYVPATKKDSKYSVMAFLQLKNNPILTHVETTYTITGQLIPGAISNCYLLKNNEKCLNYTGQGSNLEFNVCNEIVDSQFFSIIFNGIVKNQCVLEHINSKKILKYKDGIFTLTDAGTAIDAEYTLFTMS